jgi:hypothetical protein
MIKTLLILAALAATAGADSAPAPAAAPAVAPPTAPRQGAIFAQTVRDGTTILPTGAGAKARPLARGENFSASGQIVNAPSGLALMFVLSNGDALFLPAGGRVTLDEFTQDPAFNTSGDNAYEPSRSTLRLTLAQGTLAVSGRQPVPTSAFMLATPLAQLSFHSPSFVVQADKDNLALTLFDGTVDVTVPETGFHDTLLAGQTATLTRQNLHAPYPLQLTTITTDDHDHFRAWLAIAGSTGARFNFSSAGPNLVAVQRVPQSFTEQISADDPRYR